MDVFTISWSWDQNYNIPPLSPIPWRSNICTETAHCIRHQSVSWPAPCRNDSSTIAILCMISSDRLQTLDRTLFSSSSKSWHSEVHNPLKEASCFLVRSGFRIYLDGKQTFIMWLTKSHITFRKEYLNCHSLIQLDYLLQLNWSMTCRLRLSQHSLS